MIIFVLPLLFSIGMADLESRISPMERQRVADSNLFSHQENPQLFKNRVKEIEKLLDEWIDHHAKMIK